MVAVSFQFNDEQRERFAGELLRNPTKPFDAAVVVFGLDNPAICAYVAAEWPHDPAIAALQNKIALSEKASDFVPSKEQALLRLWQWTNTGDQDDRLKSMKLLAEMQGWIIKSEDITDNDTPPSIHYAIGEDHDKVLDVSASAENHSA